MCRFFKFFVHIFSFFYQKVYYKNTSSRWTLHGDFLKYHFIWKKSQKKEFLDFFRIFNLKKKTFTCTWVFDISDALKRYIRVTWAISQKIRSSLDIFLKLVSLIGEIYLPLSWIPLIAERTGLRLILIYMTDISTLKVRLDAFR